MLAPSAVPIISAPLRASFMLPVPDASVPASEICCDRSAAGMMTEAVGRENIFVFGLDIAGVRRLRAMGYVPGERYAQERAISS
jgi:hypothetical protein